MSAAFHSWVVPGGFLASEGQAKRSQVWVLNVSRPGNWFQEWDSHSVYTFWIQARVGGIGLAHSSLTARPHSRFAIGFSLENLNSGRCFLSSTYSFCSCYVLRRVDHKTSAQTQESPWRGCLLHGFLFSSLLLLYIHCLRRASADNPRLWVSVVFSQETHWRQSKWNSVQPTCLTNIICVLHYLWWLTGSSFPASPWCSSPHITTVGKDWNSKFQS